MFSLLLVYQILLFEGSITLLVPLQEAVDTPSQRAAFPAVYQRVIIGIIIWYAFFGISCWASFGDDVRTVMTTSLPPGAMATTVQVSCLQARVYFEKTLSSNLELSLHRYIVACL